jgi:hypothetical protein
VAREAKVTAVVPAVEIVGESDKFCQSVFYSAQKTCAPWTARDFAVSLAMGRKINCANQKTLTAECAEEGRRVRKEIQIGLQPQGLAY